MALTINHRNDQADIRAEALEASREMRLAQQALDRAQHRLWEAIRKMQPT